MLYKIKFLTTEKEYEIYPQFKINDKFTTDLDMFEFTLKPVEEEIDFDFSKYNGLIPMLLKVDGSDFKLMYLSYYKQTVVAYTPKKKYKYFIQATSLTLQLQRIVLPNKLVTQPLNDEKRTVWEELSKILEVYAPNVWLNPDLEDLLSIPIPELQFTKSTLYEVLVAMFAVAGLAPKMTHMNFIDYIDLKSSRASINWQSKDLFIRMEKTNNISNYTDALDYDIENFINKSETITTHWLSPTSNDVAVTTDNFIWKTPSDIYEIVKVQAYAELTIKYDTDTDVATKTEKKYVDITDYVIPKNVWEVLKVSSSGGVKEGEYKRNYVYFEGNELVGNFTESTWYGIDAPKSIACAIILAYKKTDSTAIETSVKTKYRDIVIQVTYKAIKSGSRVKIVKDDIITPTNDLISNQDDSYIDTDNFGKQKKELVNRMGNETIKAQTNFSFKGQNLSEIAIADLGDYVDNDYIIAEREMQFNEHNLLVNYTLAKNYIFLTSYSGINQLKRFTSIDTTNCLVRNDLILKTLQLSLADNCEDKELSNFVIKDYGSSSKAPQMHLVKTYDINDEEIFDGYAIVTTQNSFISDSVVCQFGFETNAKVGDSIEVEDDAYIKKPLKYVDNNGEFKSLLIRFNTPGNTWFTNNTPSITRMFPRLPANYSIDDSDTFSEDILLYKDNREITSISFQFRFVGDNETVLVYNNFAKYTRLTSNKTTFKVYSMMCADEEEFKNNLYKNNTLIPRGKLQDSSIAWVELQEIDGRRYIKLWNIRFVEGYWLIGVTDEEGNLLFALNYENTDGIKSTSLYLNEI